MEPIQADLLDDNLFSEDLDDNDISLEIICGFCFLKTEPMNVKLLAEIMTLVDMNEIAKYLELDITLIDFVCEDCFDKLLNIGEFKRKCHSARLEFNESIKSSEELIPDISTSDHDHNSSNLPWYNKQNNNNYQCFFCHEIICGTAEFRLHRKSCLIKDVKCSVMECKKRFTSQSGFNTHITYIHGLLRVSKYSCTTCRTTYQMTVIEFQDHIDKCMQNNDNNQQEIQCDICKVMCNSLETYVSHKMSHDTKNLMITTDDNGKTLFRKKENNNFVCDLCGKLFGNCRNIRKHKLNVHLVDFNGDMFYCDLCPISKPTKRLLYKHIKSVHIVKPMPCEICGKVYRNRELWQKHSLIHNDLKKNHVCKFCPHTPRFLCKSALQKHIKASHGGCGVSNKYLCDHKACDASYASEINLNKHKVKVHGYL